MKKTSFVIALLFTTTLPTLAQESARSLAKAPALTTQEMQTVFDFQNAEVPVNRLSAAEMVQTKGGAKFCWTNANGQAQCVDYHWPP